VARVLVRPLEQSYPPLLTGDPSQHILPTASPAPRWWWCWGADTGRIASSLAFSAVRPQPNPPSRGAGEPSGRIVLAWVASVSKEDSLLPADEPEPGPLDRGKAASMSACPRRAWLGGSPLPLGEVRMSSPQSHDGKQQEHVDQGREQLLDGEHGRILYLDSSDELATYPCSILLHFELLGPR